MMMYYMVEFDPRPGINQAQITEAYRKFTNHFQKTFPEVKFAGFFCTGYSPRLTPPIFCLVGDTKLRHTGHVEAGLLGRQGRAQVQQCAERPWHELGCQDGVKDRFKLDLGIPGLIHR